MVTFHKIDDRHCKVSLAIDYDPHGLVESVGDKLGFMGRRVQGDLERFKKFIEGRAVETGAWRGVVDQSHTVH